MREYSDDPIDDLRRGWDLHIDFAIAHSALYSLMSTRQDPSRSSVAAEAGWSILASLVHRIAQSGQLAIDELRATQLVHAAGSGTALSLIALPPAQLDMSLSTHARDAVIASITRSESNTAVPVAGPIAAAITMHANLETVDALTPSERQLMKDWLERIIGP